MKNSNTNWELVIKTFRITNFNSLIFIKHPFLLLINCFLYSFYSLIKEMRVLCNKIVCSKAPSKPLEKLHDEKISYLIFKLQAIFFLIKTTKQVSKKTLEIKIDFSSMVLLELPNTPINLISMKTLRLNIPETLNFMHSHRIPGDFKSKIIIPHAVSTATLNI